MIELLYIMLILIAFLGLPLLIILPVVFITLLIVRRKLTGEQRNKINREIKIVFKTWIGIIFVLCLVWNLLELGSSNNY